MFLEALKDPTFLNGLVTPSDVAPLYCLLLKYGVWEYWSGVVILYLEGMWLCSYILCTPFISFL
jgi:hypothetical protein